MRQTGQIKGVKDGVVVNYEHKTTFIFTKKDGTKINRDTNDAGAFDFDVPNGEYYVSAFVTNTVEKKTFPFRSGLIFVVNAQTSINALNIWISGGDIESSDPLQDWWIAQFTEAKKNADDAKAAQQAMTENGYVNSKRATLAELFGSPANGKYYTVDSDPVFIEMTPERRSGAFVDVTNHYNPNGLYIVMTWTQATGAFKKTYTISKDNGVWQKPVEVVKAGSYGVGGSLSIDGDLLNKEVSGFYRDQSSSRGYPTSSNLNAVILGYGKTRMNGIAFQATSNEAWIFNDTTKVFNKIVTQDTNGAIEYKSTASNGVVSKITNIGDVKKDDYIINSGFTHFIVTRPDGLQSRWIFPFKEGINTIGEDASKSGIGLTRTEHVTFPASTPNDDRIKSLMSRGNGIYRMIGNIGTAQNPAVLTMHSSDSDEEISSLIAVDMYRNRVGVAFRQNKTAPVVQGDLYTTLNTTVDTNGFIKKASPIIKLFDDHIEWNQDFKEAPIFEKVAPGTYKILNTHGLAREGWTYEKPRGKDGNTYFKIKVQKLDDGCIISVHDYFVDYEDITIIDDVGNKRTVKKQIEVLSQARDIKPEERWIDLRFFEKVYDLTNEPPVIHIPYHPLWGVEPYIPPVVEQIEENIALLDQRAF